MKSPEKRVAARASGDSQTPFQSLLDVFGKTTGIFFLMSGAFFVAWYFQMLHENLLWFSNIREVEREISFRTEQGLYYSFYKKIVNSQNFMHALESLKVDNVTESGRTINIFNRFNIFQEVVLAAIYRYFNIQMYIAPVLFYVKFVFALQAVLAVGIYLNAWILGRSWLAGGLSLCWFVCHKNDTTRVNYSVPLRESFSLPFIFCQMAVVSLYLRHGLTPVRNVFQMICLVCITVLTFLYIATWQFTQFVSLMQIGTLYLLALTGQVPTSKVLCIILVHTACLLTVCLLQYGNLMLVTSLVMSFIPFAFISLLIRCRGSLYATWKMVLTVLVHSATVLVATLTLNYGFKLVMSDASDHHIFKFIMGKFGFDNPRDFESRLYLCNEAFKFMDYDTFVRLCGGLLLPVFCLVLFAWLSHVVYNILVTWSFDCSNFGKQRETDDNYPVVAFHTIQTLSFAAIAMTTMRMKCLWVPHICIIAASGITNRMTWRRLGDCVTYKCYISGRVLSVLLVAYLIQKLIPFVQEQMEDLNEFWDPDTVELMEWIQSNTPNSATFAGSMQLMAGVKLCTGRSITNHPHFEDEWLRRRTLEIYQVYAKQPPELIYELLRRAGATHVILEDSICLTPSEGFCHLVDILDLQNGHAPEFGSSDMEGLVNTYVPRFCDEIRSGDSQYSSLFKTVFVNKTFRIYQLRSKQVVSR